MTRIRAKMVKERIRELWELTILCTCLVTEILAAFNSSRSETGEPAIDDDTWSRNNERSGWLESALATDDLFSFHVAVQSVANSQQLLPDARRRNRGKCREISNLFSDKRNRVSQSIDRQAYRYRFDIIIYYKILIDIIKCISYSKKLFLKYSSLNIMKLIEILSECVF